MNSLDTASALEYTCCILLWVKVQLVFLKFGCALSSDLRAQNCNCLVVSSVVIGPVILGWCLVLLFQTNRATHEQIRMAFHRSHFRIIRYSWSSDKTRSWFRLVFPR